MIHCDTCGRAVGQTHRLSCYQVWGRRAYARWWWAVFALALVVDLVAVSMWR